MAPIKRHSEMNFRTRKSYAALGKRQQRAVRRKYRIAHTASDGIHQVIQTSGHLQQIIQRRTEQVTRPDHLLPTEVHLTPEVHNPLPESTLQERNQNVDPILQNNSPANTPVAKSTATNCDKHDWNELSFVDKLTHAFLSTAMTHVQSSKILHVLKTHPCLHFLPADSRTLLKTPRKPGQMKVVEPGEYLHIGLQEALVRILRFMTESIPDELELDLHADGAELYKNISRGEACTLGHFDFRNFFCKQIITQMQRY